MLQPIGRFYRKPRKLEQDDIVRLGGAVYGKYKGIDDMVPAGEYEVYFIYLDGTVSLRHLSHDFAWYTVSFATLQSNAGIVAWHPTAGKPGRETFSSWPIKNWS